MPHASVFTPTHNPQWLSETYETLAIQNHIEWEWVLIPKPEVVDKIPAHIRADRRVLIVPYESDRVGELKNFACSVASGDCFVELDHDDYLTPDILRDIVAQVDQGAGFVYSDDAVFMDENGRRYTLGFAIEHGWQTYPEKIYNRYWCVTRAFPVSPRSLCEVFYCPDHVRAWSRQAYDAVGGHNVLLEVGDDHELMCRTYLAGEKFAHIPRCGYLYRLHSANTFNRKRVPLLTTVLQTRASYLAILVAEWARRLSLPIVDLDQETGYRLRGDNTVACFVAKNLLRGLPLREFVPLVNSLYPLLIAGGWVFLEADSSFPKDEVLKVTERKWALEDGRTRCRYQALAVQTKQEGNTLQIVLSALKGQRQPGPIHI